MRRYRTVIDGTVVVLATVNAEQHAPAEIVFAVAEVGVLAALRMPSFANLLVRRERCRRSWENGSTRCLTSRRLNTKEVRRLVVSSPFAPSQWGQIK